MSRIDEQRNPDLASMRWDMISLEFYPLFISFLILVGVQLILLGLIVDHLTKKLDRIGKHNIR
jgi:hypothetical protein